MKWIPMLLLVFIWFFPGQTVPDGLLEGYAIIRWLTYFIIPVLFAYYLLKLTTMNRKWDMTPIMIPVILIIFWTLLSGMTNQKGMFNTISSFGLYLRYPILFLVFVNMGLSERTIRRTINLFLILTFLQLPETITRYLVWGIRGDALSFTLGPFGTYALGVYCLYATCIIVAQMLLYRFKLSNLALLLALLIPAGIGEIKALFFFYPIVILAMLLYSMRKDLVPRGRYFIYGTTIAITALLLQGFMLSNWEKLAGSSITMRNLESLVTGRQTFDPLAIDRIAALYHGLIIVSSNVGDLLLGLGPGSSLAGNFTGHPGIFTQRLSRSIGYTTTMGQWVTILGDVGVIGTLLHLWMFIILLRSILRTLRTSKDTFHRILSLAFVGIWVFYVLLGPLYNVVWRYDGSSYMFWFIAAGIYVLGKKQALVPRTASE